MKKSVVSPVVQFLLNNDANSPAQRQQAQVLVCARVVCLRVCFGCAVSQACAWCPCTSASDQARALACVAAGALTHASIAL